MIFRFIFVHKKLLGTAALVQILGMGTIFNLLCSLCQKLIGLLVLWASKMTYFTSPNPNVLVRKSVVC